MHALIEELLSGGTVVTDGAWGTQLQARGLGLGDFPDAWNLSQPELVLEVARAYVQAGSRIILTNTFGANRVRMAELPEAAQVAEINREGVKLSRQAAGTRARVFASVGPTGKLLMSGEVSEEEIASAFGEQTRVLAEAGADALVVETMADPAEAELAVRAAKATGLPVVACMVFDSGKDKDRTMMGTTPEEAARRMLEAGADIVGANCGQGIQGFAGICRRLRAASSLPVWIKANAGLPKMSGDQATYETTPGQFASFVPELVELGAGFVGGCCGTSPAFISAMVGELQARHKS